MLFRRWLSYKNNTVFALSTPAGKSAISVFRITGPSVVDVYSKLCPDQKILKPRVATLRKIQDPEKSNSIIDECIVIYFPKPRSYTGEDLLEIHGHGGIGSTRAMIRALSAPTLGLNMAEPGEFTQRAFYNGKLNLTQIEGLSDLINANTEMQRKTAMLSVQGLTKNYYTQIQNNLIEVLALVEAVIDFEEMDQIDENTLDTALIKLKSIKENLLSHVRSSIPSEVLNQGIKTAIIGLPNAGKSSLINIMSQRLVSIVSSVSGTTRDAVDVCLDVSGYPVIFTDTAGIKGQTSDEIEEIGINIALQKAKDADLILLIIGYDQVDQKEQISEMFKRANISSSKTIIILNKIDLATSSDDISEAITSLSTMMNCHQVCAISCLNNKNQEASRIVTNVLSPVMNQLLSISEHSVFSINERQMLHCKNALQHIETCEMRLNDTADDKLVMAAEDLRQAVYSLSNVLGSVDVEQILDRIFAQFCIGK